ncbi:MAG: hypothetical protein ABIK96_14180 [bacterium]
MRKFIALIVVVGSIGFVVKCTVNQHQEQLEAERQAAEVRAQRDAALAAFIAKYDAVDGWEDELSEGRSILDGLMTAELQKVWLTAKPIVFKGAINDIEIRDENSYKVHIRKTPLTSSLGLIMHELGLSLVANRDFIDQFIEEHPVAVGQYNFITTLYVVAKIDSISNQVDVVGSEAEEVRVGHGVLLDLFYTQ